MALKKQQTMLATFSMASMTDVVFLLLVFFMVTSTFVFPTAMEINLPQSSEQTELKPVTVVYVTADGQLAGRYGDGEIQEFKNTDDMVEFLSAVREQDPEAGFAIHADAAVEYGQVVNILNIGAQHGLKMVLATTPRAKATTNNSETPASTEPTASEPSDAELAGATLIN